MKDSGVIGCGTQSRPSAGRWVDDEKDGRKRNLHVYLNDQGENVNDQAYFGYFHDLNKVVACNLAIILEGDSVCIQTLKPGGTSDDVKIKRIPASKFMDILDLLIS